MLYFANPVSVDAVAHMRAGTLGFIDTPAQRVARPAGVAWCADNGCYGKGWPGPARWWQWLVDNAADAATCQFATAPDVVGDARATLAASAPWLPRIRQLGYPAALVAQDGLELAPVPWDAFDVLFVGGSTGWKLGAPARALIAEAKRRGKRVHVGRVNSRRRWDYCAALGVDSCDGTMLVYGPTKYLPEVLGWAALRPLPVGGRA